LKKDPFAKREAQKYDNPIASREHILEVFESIGEPTAFKQLSRTLGIDDSSSRDALKTRLNAMVRAGQLLVDKRHVYAIASRMELPTGKISAHPDGYGFLLQEGEDIFLTRRQMQQVFHGDIARVRIRSRDRRGRIEGEIVEVIERNTRQLVGRYVVENGVKLLEPLNNRINQEVLLNNDGIPCELGQIVTAEIVDQPSIHGVVRASITQVLGDHMTPGIEVEIALRNNDIPVEQTDEVSELVDRMPSEVRPKDKLSRFDLTELPFVTIDGEDARDFDDAVYCEARERGGWRLYVAIADVAEYVELDSVLDQSAFQRGTSVYFPQYVVPMLPEKLSNGLCSLKPKVERLALVCEMTISAKGKMGSYQFYEGTIFSHARLTYTQVAKVIVGDEETRGLLGNVVPHLDELNSLYKVLSNLRSDRGAIDFDTTELQFQFSSDGRVEKISPRSRNTAHKIIEECMLCANVCAARFIGKHDKPGLFRVHEPPREEKVEYLRDFLSRFGIELNADEEITPADYQAVVQQLRGRENGHVLQMALLRSMNQAVYQVKNEGHFGLGYSEYTHFTSPIRRYPDLLTHRYIKSIIHSADENNLVARRGKPSKRNYYPYSMEQVLAYGEQTSFAERRANSAVYEVLEWIKCDYVSNRLGDVVEGVITGTAKFGFFVELSDVFVEGLVHISALSGDYFHYDQAAQCLVGEKSGRVYGLGDIVEVRVAKVNVDERKVDFELMSHRPLADRKKEKARKSPDKAGTKRKPKSKKVGSERGAQKRKPAEGKAETKNPVKKNKKRPSKKRRSKNQSSKNQSSKNQSSKIKAPTKKLPGKPSE
jgi:ribonuclease R